MPVPSLAKSIAVYGGSKLIKKRPAIRRLTNAIFVPFAASHRFRHVHPGLYTEEQILIPEAAYFRGVPQFEMAEHLNISINLRPTNRYNEATCLYIGSIHPHYGHFLMSTLSRLWPYYELSAEIKNLKILYRTPPVPLGHEEQFFRLLVACLGIDVGAFITFTDTTALDDVIVPAPSAIENHCIYDVFRDFFHRMGEDLAGHIPRVTNARPVFFTKHRLKSGVTRVHNEEEMVSRLAAAGVEVIAPEEFSLPEQIALMRDRVLMCGFTGSVFHTSAFTPASRFLIIHHETRIWSNQLLIDIVNGNHTLHLFPWRDSSFFGCDDDSFAINVRLHRPRQTADQLLRLIDHCLKRPPNCNGLRNGSEGLNPTTQTLRPLGANIALGKPARQSSISMWSIGDSIAKDAAGAVNGTLSGRYRFHTGRDHEPWWEVDLEKIHRVTGVTVYNRLDQGDHRATGLRILGSVNGADWVEVFRHTGDTVVGGLWGEPLIWIAHQPERFRYIRTVLPGDEYLHLDQVEVFGEELDDIDECLDAFAAEKARAEEKTG